MALFPISYVHTIFYFYEHTKHSDFIILISIVIAGLFQWFSASTDKGAYFLFYLVIFLIMRVRLKVKDRKR